MNSEIQKQNLPKTSWVTCVVDNDYQININYPHQIRRRSNKRIISESLMNTGYIQCCMNREHYLKHRIISEQFIPNPNNLPCVDHIDHDKTNNRINNLRWCSSSENNFNISSRNGIEYEFFDEIDEDAIVVDHYSKWQFEEIYFTDNTFYFYNGIAFRKLHIIEGKSGALSVRTIDINGFSRAISYSKFKREYGLI